MTSRSSDTHPPTTPARRARNLRRGVGASLAAVALLAAGGLEPSRAHAAGATTLTVELVNVSWPSLDPAGDTAQIVGNQPVMTAVYGSLFTLSPSGALVPDLARSYSLSPSKTTLTVNLRPGLKFSDGTPLNAQAVDSNWTADLAAAKVLGLTTGWSAFTTGFKVASPTSIQLLLSKPYQAILPCLTNQTIAYIASPHALASEGATKFGVNPVGAGPFKVVTDTQNAQINFTKNSLYWDPSEPKVANLDMTVVSSGTSALDAVNAGDAQLIWANGGVDPSTLSQATSPSVSVVNPPATWWEFLNFSLKSKAFASNTAREAVSYATDGALIDKALYNDRYAPDSELIGPGEKFYAPKAIHTAPYNPAKAKALVKQLGGLSFTLSPEFNTPTWVTLAEALQRQWQAAGMKVTILTSEESAYLQRQDEADYDIDLAQYGGSVDPALTSSNFVAQPIIGATLPPEVTLIDSSENGATPGARQAAYNALFNYVATEHLAIPLFSKSPSYIQAKSLTGIPASYNLVFTDAQVNS
jgi:peptide/nickel transport system substrate-binding protein